MSAFFLNILSTFSPLRNKSVNTIGGKGVSVETVAAVAAAEAATTEGVVEGGDDVFDDDGDLWFESIESPVAEASTTASSLTSGGTVGRASKCRRVGGDESVNNEPNVHD